MDLIRHLQTQNRCDFSCSTKLLSAPTATSIFITGLPVGGDRVNITVANAALSGGSYKKNFQVIAGSTITSLAASIASQINGDTSLSNAGIKAGSFGNMLLLTPENTSGPVTATANTNGDVTQTLVGTLPAETVSASSLKMLVWPEAPPRSLMLSALAIH
jgi:hypothetical protein